MVRQKIIVEKGYRTDDVEGAIVTLMGIVESENGGLRAFIDFDDSKGMATYNLSVKGEVAGTPDDSGNYRIPGYLDFGKVNKSFQKLGYEPYMDVDDKEWGLEPDIIGEPIWIKCVKTSTDKEGKEYKSLIEVIKIGDGQETKPTPTPAPTPKSGKTSAPAPAPVKGGLTDQLLHTWKEIVETVLTEPLNEAGINLAVKKLYPDEYSGKNAAFRKSLADVRTKALQALVKEGLIEINESGKYSLTV